MSVITISPLNEPPVICAITSTTVSKKFDVLQNLFAEDFAAQKICEKWNHLTGDGFFDIFVFLSCSA